MPSDKKPQGPIDLQQRATLPFVRTSLATNTPIPMSQPSFNPLLDRASAATNQPDEFQQLVGQIGNMLASEPENLARAAEAAGILDQYSSAVGPFASGLVGPGEVLPFVLNAIQGNAGTQSVSPTQRTAAIKNFLQNAVFPTRVMTELLNQPGELLQTLNKVNPEAGQKLQELLKPLGERNATPEMLTPKVIQLLQKTLGAENPLAAIKQLSTIAGTDLGSKLYRDYLLQQGYGQNAPGVINQQGPTQTIAR